VTPPRFRSAALAGLILIGLCLCLADCGSTDRNGAFRELSYEAPPIACSEFKVGYDMTVSDFGVSQEIRGSYAAFAQAMGDYVALSTKLLDDVTAACRTIAFDLGGTESAEELRGRTGEEASYGWCNLTARKLQRALTDTLQPAGRLSFVYAPSFCTVDEPYVRRCEAACSKDASCVEKEISQRCDAAHTTGLCTGKCTGVCLGSAVAPALCEGKCEAACQGPCLGDCTGMCEGQPQYGGGRCRGTCIGICGGVCRGRCTGVCHFARSASAKCDGSCEGGCSTAVKAPKCEADLKASTCGVGGDCEANCKASGQARASCTEPSVIVGAQDDVGVNLDILGEIHTLQRNLPVLFLAGKSRGPQLELEVKGAYEAGGRVVSGVPPLKLGKKGQECSRVMMAAGEQALQNIHVAIEASKSVLTALPLER
jgi:hypothetical protein